MNNYKNYMDVLRSILKNFNDEQFNDIIRNILINTSDIYYLERDIQKYNIDNVFKKYKMNMYNLLRRKYIMTTSKRLMFIKHKYDKKEYIIKFSKKNNIVSNDDETCSFITNEILKNYIDCYTKYINDFCKNRIINKKEIKICFHPPCYNKVLSDNYCSNHQDKKYVFKFFHIKNKVYIYYI